MREPLPRPHRLRAACATLAASLLGAACSLVTPPPVEEVLTTETHDERCTRLLADWRAQSDDPQLALAAARALFETVDLTVQQALVEATRELRTDDPAVIVAAEAELPETIRDRVLGLAGEGSTAAQAAIDGFAARAPASPELVDAHVHLALHLIFVAWANGPMRSIMGGLPKRIDAAMDAALGADRTFDHGAPLRLKGRYLAKAPWPVGDSDAALALLREAVQVAPLPIHHLFLGDHLLQRGERDEAVAEWRAVLTDEADATTAAVLPWHRAMAELRLAASR